MTHTEVHVTIGTNVDIGQGQRSLGVGDEFTLFADIGRTIWLQVDRVHGGKGPVAYKQGVAVMGGKFRICPSDYTGGATGADVDHRAHCIGKVFTPLLGGRPPAAFTTGNTMVDASGPIPGSPDIPFHIRVVNE